MTKSELRKKYKALRAELSENEIQKKSLLISEQVTQLDIWNKDCFHLFLTMKNQKEINTSSILKSLQKQAKKVVVSKSDFSNNSLSHFLLTEETKITLNTYGIPEPEGGLSISEKEIDVVFIPLLAFDKKGNRTGYGKGFYDGFLAKCNPETIKIGLSFFEAENTITNVFELDIPLDYCVTPNKVYQF